MRMASARALPADHQETLMRAGIRLCQPARAAASGSVIINSVVPFKARMSTAAAAEPAAAAPEQKPDAVPVAPDAPAAAAATPDQPVESTAPLPDASSDPIVAGVLKRFVQQYETKDTKEQVLCSLLDTASVAALRSISLQANFTTHTKVLACFTMRLHEWSLPGAMPLKARINVHLLSPEV